jgi:hypothetical protein
MALTFNQFFSAISEQESGGRYNARGVLVNGHRAYGKYQVMDFNIPSWTRQYFGKSLTPEQFLNNPKAQEAVAKGKLKSYWDKYGARGAASAWYSGDPNLNMSTKPQPGGPSIKTYVDEVLSKAAKYPAGGGTSSGSSSSGGGGSSKPDPLSGSELAETYGFVSTLFDSVPELKKLFQKAVSGQWAAGKFQAELRDTKWWKTKSESARQFLILQYGDPATAKQKLAQALVHVKQLSNQLGVRGGSDMAKQLDKWALHMVMDDWDDARLRYDMGKWISFGGDIRSGEGGEAVDKLKEYAYNMGVTMTSKWYANAGRAIVRGVATDQDYEDQIRRQAKTIYTQWSKQLDSGQTVADIAAPYFSSMSQILELPAGSINLFDPSIKKALQNKDKVTGASSIKPLWQFENDLRSDERWKGTQNAQNSMMQIAHQVLADFGVKT